MIELSRTASGELRQGFAGDSANTMIYLARLLGTGDHTVSYVTALGTDEFSEAMIAGWHAERIDTTLVRRIDGRLPGLYWINAGADGERSFYYWRKESAARLLMTDDYRRTLQEALTDYDLIFLSGITLGILSPPDRLELQALLQSLHRSGARIFFDGNFRETLWTNPAAAATSYDAVLAVASTALFSLVDAQQLWGTGEPEILCRRIADAGVQEVVLRQGTKPCLVLASGTLSRVDPPVVAAAVDTTAAGDAFDAGYIAARLRGSDPGAAAMAGHRLAARVVVHTGALLARDQTPRLADILD